VIVAGGIVAGIGFTVGATIRVSDRQPRGLGSLNRICAAPTHPPSLRDR
jgi:hypothetical protein